MGSPLRAGIQRGRRRLVRRCSRTHHPTGFTQAIQRPSRKSERLMIITRGIGAMHYLLLWTPIVILWNVLAVARTTKKGIGSGLWAKSNTAGCKRPSARARPSTSLSSSIIWSVVPIRTTEGEPKRPRFGNGAAKVPTARSNFQSIVPTGISPSISCLWNMVCRSCSTVMTIFSPNRISMALSTKRFRNRAMLGLATQGPLPSTGT